MARRRADHEAGYILDRIDTLLGARGLREHRSDWLRGDPGRSGRSSALPVDAFWPDLNLVVEVYERQHDRPVAHFDKPERLTRSAGSIAASSAASTTTAGVRRSQPTA